MFMVNGILSQELHEYIIIVHIRFRHCNWSGREGGGAILPHVYHGS